MLLQVCQGLQANPHTHTLLVVMAPLAMRQRPAAHPELLLHQPPKHAPNLLAAAQPISTSQHAAVVASNQH
jgi:hypothetical protein